MNATTRGGVWDLLVPGELDRRAIGETLADWLADASASLTLTSRVRAHASGSASLARVVMGLVWAQSHRAAAWYWCWKVLFVSGVLAIASTWAALGYFPLAPAGGRENPVGAILAAIVFGTFASIVAASGAGRPAGGERPLLAVMTGLFLTVGMMKLIGLEIALRGATDGFVLKVTMVFSALDVPMLLLFGEAVRYRLSVSVSRRAVGLVAILAAVVLRLGPGMAQLALGSSVPVVGAFPSLAPIAFVTLVLCAIWWLSRHRKTSDA